MPPFPWCNLGSFTDGGVRAAAELLHTCQCRQRAAARSLCLFVSVHRLVCSPGGLRLQAALSSIIPDNIASLGAWLGPHRRAIRCGTWPAAPCTLVHMPLRGMPHALPRA